MEGFDPTALPYLTNPLALDNFNHNATTADYLNIMPSTGIQEQVALYDTGDFGATDDASFVNPGVPSSHTRSYSNPYDDSFAQNTGQNDGGQEEQTLPETSIERDNKLLSFNLPIYNFELLNWSLQRTALSLTAQLHGMFFMAESPNSADTSAPSTELTCYRRNLFQITGSITLPRTLRYIVTEGNRIPIVTQELTISATESAEGHHVKLISVPWKTPAVNVSSTPEEKTEKEPTSIPLDTMSNQDMDADYATFPFAWKRLQFRIATANNGRRKELQQHFVVRLKVVATLSTGTKIPICEARSGAIIVRGRSPRNFQQRKDFPVGNSGNNARKNLQAPSLTRGATVDSSSPQPPVMKNELSPDLSINSFTFDKHDLQTPSTFSENKKSTGGPARPGLTGRASSDHGVLNRSNSGPSSSNGATAPIKLAPTDDPEAASVQQRSHKAPRTTNSTAFTKPPIFKHPSVSSSAPVLSARAQVNLNSGLDSADLLYEYFPLGLDDWMPPVDAVYRPHVVHHVAAGVGSSAGKPGLGGRSKRYFSEDQG